MNRLPSLLFCVLLLTGCAARAPRSEPMGVTFVPAAGDFLSPTGERLGLDRVLERAAGADYVLVGESHRNACDHGMEAAIVRGMAQGGRPPVIGLEMVAQDRQGVLDGWNTGRIGIKDLEERLEWKERWGHPFALYRPVFEAALEGKLPLAALNAPPDLVRKVGREGLEALAPEERAQLPATIIRPPQEEEAFLREVMAQHPGREDGSRAEMERFFLVQGLWDTQMAERAVWAKRQFKRPVLVLAGGGHVDHGWGIASRLKELDPGAAVFLVTAWRGVGRFEPGAADAFFYCPNVYVSRMGMTLAETDYGLRVESVTRDSRADRAGLRPGDVLEKAQGVALESLGDLHKAGVLAHDRDEALVVQVRRGPQAFDLDLGRLGQGGK